MTEKELQRIKERCEKATSGPWESPWVGNHPDAFIAKYDGTAIVGVEWYDFPHLSVLKEDAEFIANAREDIPKLIAEVEKLKKKVKQLRKKIRKIDEMNDTIISTMKIIPSRPKIELEDINFTDEWEKKEAKK